MAEPLSEKKVAADQEKNASHDSHGIDEQVVQDGVKVHPTPTKDPLDPLNFSSWKKYSIVSVVMLKYMLFTWITSCTVPSFGELSVIYNIGNSQLNWTVAIPALGLAVGPLLWSSFSDIYGRRTIFIIGTTIALCATIGAAKASDYGGYMAARFFQGLGVSPAAVTGLAVINDLFFDNQRGLAIGLWTISIDLGIFLGPLVGGFIDLVSPQWIQYLTAILFAVLLIMEFTLMTETLYPRNAMLSRMPAENLVGSQTHFEKSQLGGIEEVDIKRTKQLFIFNVKPVPGMRHPKPWDSLVRFVLSFKFSVLVIAVLGFCFLWYWWLLTLITEVPFGYPQYSPQIQGLLFLGFIIGTVFAEVFLSGRLSDYIVLRLAKQNRGIKIPEMRLWVAYPAILFSSIGLIIWGISIDRQHHWIVGQIAFFLFAAGVQIGNTAICSYIVDSYPLNSVSVITFYSVFLNLSAFISPFFISPWVTSSGFTWSFAAQGIITFFGGVPLIALLQRFGPSLRNKSGSPAWVNPEYDTSL